MNNKEIFKDIKGYENMYQISSYGRVYSKITHKFLKLNKHKCGYIKASLSKDGKMRTFLVHRLVACNFIDNPNNYPEVNHLNGDKANNMVENLQWASTSQNTKHAFDNNLGGFKDMVLNNLRKINENTSYKKIICKKGNEIIEFNSTSQAAKFFCTHRDNITRDIRKGFKICGYEVFGYRVANEESL